MKKKKNRNSLDSPFKSLKGLSLSEKDKSQPLAKISPVVTKELDFLTEMRSLGVEVFSQTDNLECHDGLMEKNEPQTLDPVNVSLNDEELFLREFSRMEKVFSDEIPDLEVPQAAPRRMKLVERGDLVPAESLDLHGFTRSEAVTKVRYFLENALHHRHLFVLIVTGWGKHGSGEAVLREEIIKFLRSDGSAFVSEWGLAPRKLGGEGALVVFLKRPTKKTK